jgi:hypothetical protein
MCPKLTQDHVLTVEHKDRQDCVTLSINNRRTCFELTREVCEKPLGNITKGRLLCILLVYEAVQNNEKEVRGKY